jgi:YfiR/HmsC-like
MSKTGARLFGKDRTRGIQRRPAGLGPVVVAAALLLPPHLYVQATAPTEYEVKAAYLYNFGLFVQWPAEGSPGQEGPFAVCVLGMDPFGRVLDAALAGEMIGSQRVVARRVDNPEEALGCRILFISSSEEAGLKEILAAAGKASVLTVSDMPNFIEKGGVIQFVTENRRVRFEINLTAAHRVGLSLSSQLLKVAIHVSGASGPEKAR